MGTDKLKTPTRVGQTATFVAYDGAVVARVYWDLLPYFVRTVWGEEAENVQEMDIEAYLAIQASPAALAAAVRSPYLTGAQKARAQGRLDELRLEPAVLQRLQAHLLTLLAKPRKQLIDHLSVGDRADNELDRVDLLAEAVALRQAKADVSSERALARAFRALFKTRDPWVVWVVAALCFGMFLLTSWMEPTASRAMRSELVLLPGLGKPWTLVTYPWLHVGWQHVMLNMVALLLVGHVLEQVLGHGRFLLVYALAAVGGGLASVVYKQALDIPFWTAGASGAIAGMAGLALFLGLWFQRRYGRIPMRYSRGTLAGGLVLVSNVLVGVASGDESVDHGAHVGGLLIGVALGLWLRPQLAARADATFGRRGKRSFVGLSADSSTQLRN